MSEDKPAQGVGIESRQQRRRREALARKGLYSGADMNAVLVQQREGLKREDFAMRFVSAVLRAGTAAISFKQNAEGLTEATLVVSKAELLEYQRVEFESDDKYVRALLRGTPPTPVADPDAIARMLELADRKVSVAVVASWSPSDRKMAEDWASAAFLAKTDPNVPVPPQPECVARAVRVASAYEALAKESPSPVTTVAAIKAHALKTFRNVVVLAHDGTVVVSISDAKIQSSDRDRLRDDLTAMLPANMTLDLDTDLCEVIDDSAAP